MNAGGSGYIEIRVGVMDLVHAPQVWHGVQRPMDGILGEIEQQDSQNASSEERDPRLLQQTVSVTGKGEGDHHRAGPVQTHGNHGANDQKQAMPAPAPLGGRG